MPCLRLNIWRCIARILLFYQAKSLGGMNFGGRFSASSPSSVQSVSFNDWTVPDKITRIFRLTMDSCVNPTRTESPEQQKRRYMLILLTSANWLGIRTRIRTRIGFQDVSLVGRSNPADLLEPSLLGSVCLQIVIRQLSEKSGWQNASKT